MKRRLLLINLALISVLGVCGFLLRQRWLEADRRKQEILGAKPAPGAKLPESAASVEPPPRAASYFDVAEKMLFAKDRNPTVVIEAKPEAKQMPPLPSVFGVMDIGSGPVVFLAAKDGPQRSYKPGDKFGEFKILEVSAQELALEWDGQTIRKKVEELRGQVREAPAAPASAPAPSARAEVASPAAPPAIAPANNTTTTTNTSPSSDSDVFGRDLGDGRKLCKPGDKAPPGTMVKGFKKVVGFSGIAPTCLWEEQK